MGEGRGRIPRTRHWKRENHGQQEKDLGDPGLETVREHQGTAMIPETGQLLLEIHSRLSKDREVAL
jgi:hypothetical protein